MWLETPEAMRIRKEHIHTDRQVLKDLTVRPPTRTTLQAAGSELQVGRKHQSLVLWHYRCFQEALQRFRRWRKGCMSTWACQGPQLAVLDTEDGSVTNVETVADMSQRQDYWWKTVLTQTVRRCIALQIKRPQLLTEDAWETLLTRLQIALQSTKKGTQRERTGNTPGTFREPGKHTGDTPGTHREPTGNTLRTHFP